MSVACGHRPVLTSKAKGWDLCSPGSDPVCLWIFPQSLGVDLHDKVQPLFPVLLFTLWYWERNIPVAKNNQERENLRRNFHQNAGKKHVWFSGYSFHIRGILSSYNGRIVKSRVYFSRGLILLLVRRWSFVAKDEPSILSIILSIILSFWMFVISTWCIKAVHK